jgi:cysteine desulfurase
MSVPPADIAAAGIVPAGLRPADIRVVLVETSHPGNIGAVARAMKNMGLLQLVLVRPKSFPDPEATARASGATDVLERARVVPDLVSGIGDCGLVIATTARERDPNIRVLEVREAAVRAVEDSARGPVALLFGNERTGLTNDELAFANLLLRIPANPEYSSLNLAMAVQLVTYEIYRARGASYAQPARALAAELGSADVPLATAADMARLYTHFATVLEEIDFRDRTASGRHLMDRIRRFLNRAELDQNEVNILRGILTAVQRKRRMAGTRIAPPAAADVAPEAAAASTTPVFLDHASTTPLDPVVADAMAECLRGGDTQGNASSATHALGRAALARIEQARAEVAALLGAAPSDIVFTSGATEADNLALLGIARGRADLGRHLVVARTEHKAVIDPARALEKHGFEVTWLEPDASGRITPQSVAAALRPDTQLVSVMHANNETGLVNDIAGIAAVCHAQGVLLHSDAAQSAGKLPLSMTALGADLLSVSAHKMYGPKGIGALVVTAAARPWLEPLMYGGPQERGLRPGTPATHQAVGFGKAAALAAGRLEDDAAHAASLAARFLARLEGLPGLRFNHASTGHASTGHAAPDPTAPTGLPGLLSISVEGVEGESLLAGLSEVAVSGGAACDSASGEPSYVLRALGLAPELAQATLRIMFGRHNRPADADLAAAALRRTVLALRAADAPGAPEGEGWVAGEAGRVREGTRVRCYLRTDPARRISAVEWRIFGCPQTRAVAAGLDAALRGRTAADAAAAVGTPAGWAARYSVPTEKLGRLLRVEDALRQALGRITAATESP